MVKTKEDLTGRVFGWLTVLMQAEDHVSPNGARFARWLCECSCEKHTLITVLGYSLTKKNGTRSCGCLVKENVSKANRKPNKYDTESADYVIGYTSNNEPFWFDREDFELVNSYTGWCYNERGHVYCNANGGTLLHRLVMGVTDKKIEVDHKNHPPRNEHKIDNRKSNLEIVTRSQNMMNRSLAINNTSGVTGVRWHKFHNKWHATIKINQKPIHLGYFDNFDDAIKARKEAEKKYFGKRRYDANN